MQRSLYVYIKLTLYIIITVISSFQTQFLMETFEDVAVKLYDLLDLKRQWRNYMSNLRLYRIAQLTHDKGAPR